MRLDDLYLVDIIEANEAIERMLSGISFDEFAAQEPLSPAVQMKLVIMGEALSSMKSETRETLPVEAVRRIRGLRNRIVHGYFTINNRLVHAMATRHAPRLARAAEGALKKLFPETYDRLKQRRYEGITD